MHSVKSRAIDWLFQQGVSTVLLFLLVYGLADAVERVVPRLLAEKQAGYERIVHAHDRQLRLLIDEFRADQDRDQETLHRLLAEDESRCHRVANGSSTTP